MTIDDFKLAYPELSQSFIDEQIGLKIRLANLFIDKLGNFGEARNDALGLLIAHMLTLGKNAGKKGASNQTKTSKKVGEVSYTYAQESHDRAWYNLSHYGQQLLWIIDLQPKYGGAFVV